MNFAELVTIITHAWAANPKHVFHIEGVPGIGKTEVCYAVNRALGFPDEAVGLFRPSIRDSMDWGGLPVPDFEKFETKFTTPDIVAYVNGQAEEHGHAILLLDETPQADKAMQCAIAGGVYDKTFGSHKMHPAVKILSTGNRVEDGAGASRILTQLGNRLCTLPMEADLEQWVEDYAIPNNIPEDDIACLRYEPRFFCDFRADRATNPTPRAHALAATFPQTLGDKEYLSLLTGYLGSAAAAHRVQFRKFAAQLVRAEDIVADPDGAPVPDEPGVLFATVSRFHRYATKNNSGALFRYLMRLPPQYARHAGRNIYRAVGASALMCEEFKTWANRFQDALS